MDAGECNESFTQRILDIFLQGAAQRTGSIAAVGAGFFEDVPGGIVVKADFDLLGDQVDVDLVGGEG
jgi:hypothetical protein